MYQVLTALDPTLTFSREALWQAQSSKTTRSNFYQLEPATYMNSGLVGVLAYLASCYRQSGPVANSLCSRTREPSVYIYWLNCLVSRYNQQMASTYRDMEDLTVPVLTNFDPKILFHKKEKQLQQQDKKQIHMTHREKKIRLQAD